MGTEERPGSNGAFIKGFLITVARVNLPYPRNQD